MPVVGVAAAGDGEAVLLRRGVELAPADATAGDGGLRLRVDLDRLQQREVDHQAAVADGVAGGCVTAALHGDEQVVLAREVDALLDVVGVGGLGDQAGVLVDHAVEDVTGFVVAGVARARRTWPLKAGRELFDVVVSYRVIAGDLPA